MGMRGAGRGTTVSRTNDDTGDQNPSRRQLLLGAPRTTKTREKPYRTIFKNFLEGKKHKTTNKIVKELKILANQVIR